MSSLSRCCWAGVFRVDGLNSLNLILSLLELQSRCCWGLFVWRFSCRNSVDDRVARRRWNLRSIKENDDKNEDVVREENTTRGHDGCGWSFITFPLKCIYYTHLWGHFTLASYSMSSNFRQSLHLWHHAGGCYFCFFLFVNDEQRFLWHFFVGNYEKWFEW